jgi:hypothetical protein
VTSRVEIAFDLSADPTRDFATLDDPVKGILESPIYVLGGALLIDITDKVTDYSVTRGKTRQLDRYPAGLASIRLDNNDRTFDPLFNGSPYSGQIIPRRDVRISKNGIVQYNGVIDDWNLDYSPNGASYAQVTTSDSLTIFANQTLNPRTNTAQFSGERVNAILNLPEVGWPTDRRNINTGKQFLQTDTIAANTNTLEYLQKVTESEPGSLFVSKNGRVTFKDRTTDASSSDLVTLSDDGVGIPYQEIRVVFGAELLYNQVIVTRLNGGTAIAQDLQSQTEYGITTLALDDLLMDSDDDAADLAKFLVGKYAQPEYRFESLSVELETLTTAQQNALMNLELGDVVEVKFTPNNIPPAIDRFVEIIKIDQRVTPTSHRVTFGLGALDYSFWRLSDPVFGRLSAGNSLAY